MNFSHSHLGILILWSIDYLHGDAYGASLHRIFNMINDRPNRTSKENRLSGDVPTIYGYLKRYDDLGWISREWGLEGKCSVRKCKTTAEGKRNLAILLREIDGFREGLATKRRKEA